MISFVELTPNYFRLMLSSVSAKRYEIVCGSSKWVEDLQGEHTMSERLGLEPSQNSSDAYVGLAVGGSKLVGKV